MLFFKRILKEGQPVPIEGKAPQVERRRTRRYAVNSKFPLKALLSFGGRNDTTSPTGHPRPAWKWEGRLVDCSEHGARIQMNPGQKVGARDLCDLRLTVEEFNLTIPCHISNITGEGEKLQFGLQHNIEDEATRKAYAQLLEVLALGSALRLESRTNKPDESGYLVENYSSDRPARLTVWRLPKDRGVVAFEFLLKDCLVRTVAGQPVEYRSARDNRPVTAAKAREIKRLFQWVVPNIAPEVAEDVRKILRRYSAEPTAGGA
ncbi:MAG TPA: PilZ domain-containing protein [Lacunisphaera sp.]|nr:PilZ domain-containing protein [Lacunisphaera sp.]